MHVTLPYLKIILPPPHKEKKTKQKNNEDELSAKWSELPRGHIAALLTLEANWLAAPTLVLPHR